MHSLCKWTLSSIAAVACLSTAGAAPAAPPLNAVDLQLVLAVDVSLSMSQVEQRVQRDGYAAAFKSLEVQKAITSGPLGRIAVTYIEWSGYRYQRVVVPWRILGDAEDALVFAEALE